MALAENIKEKRIEKGMVQETLAGLAGISRKQLACYETGERLPNIYVGIALAKALDTTVEELARVKENDNNE